MNLLKQTILARNNPLGSLTNWKSLVNNVGNTGDTVSTEKLIGTLQKIGFSESGRLLVKELEYAEEFIPQLKGIVKAWGEWEPDYYDNAVRSATS
ncbi:hypothetical protein CHU98_g11470 [Xylaria longipes]|nr:hypothetical protein CHU98_g11470 [Xylaria longipes]